MSTPKRKINPPQNQPKQEEQQQPIVTEVPKISFNVDVTVFNIILRGLGELPHRESAFVINGLVDAAKKQGFEVT
jgi:hypothetical protein